MTEEEKINAQIERYQRALHAMQTGVAHRMAAEPNGETSPKHLRTGVNSALIDSGALAKLLMDKGIFTPLEYYTALADFAERDKASYEEWIRNHYGNDKITLG